MTSQPPGGQATNRLAHESSPYLRQHMHNPVDWYPWSEEALERARAEDRPIFLSVGYSTCHWCHVMAHESFENEAVARYLNAHFVCVKLDREERPDIDAVYMRAVQAMTGAGGWPMSVFLTPDLRPFYAATYLPPNDAHGLPSFGRVLASVVRAWDEQRDSLEHNAGVLTEAVQEGARPPRSAELPDRARALGDIAGLHDARHGGFGGAPKFPAPTLLQYLLSEEEGRPLALHTLSAMARSGLYDQLGGGYHRYSVDAAFAVPHFEKMLYDNAQLVSAHLLAWRYGGGEAHANTARDVLAYLEREMRAPGGGYFAAQDADSGGIEGQFFVWTPGEVRAALAAAGLEEHTEAALRLFAVTEAGNFRDPHHPDFGSRSVLQRQGNPEDGDSPHWSTLRRALWEAREAREKPHTDRKVLTSWNGLTLSALADAALAFPGEGHLERAQALMDFVEGTMTPGGVLHHSLGEGDPAPRVTGLLEDHALYGLGLLALHAAGGGEAPLRRAHELWNTVREEFWDADAGVFYSSAEGAGTPLARQAEGFDAAVLSDNAAAARLGLLLARHGLAPEGEETARAVLQAFGAQMRAAPQGFGGLWAVQALLEESASEIALLRGGRSDDLLAVLGRTPLPRTVLSVLDEGSALPLGQGRRAGELYLCRNHACTAPLSDPDTLPGRLQAELGVTPVPEEVGAG